MTCVMLHFYLISFTVYPALSMALSLLLLQQQDFISPMQSADPLR